MAPALSAQLEEARREQARLELQVVAEPTLPESTHRPEIPAPSTETGPLASRIVMLSEPKGDRFRARLRLKAEPAAMPTPVPDRLSACAPPAGQVVPDSLELIDGLSRRAVELLLDGGVARFADIAAWSSADVATWRSRLDGATQGSAGAWIEQAAYLATGRSTCFAARARRGEYAALVAAPPPEPPRPSARAPVKPAVPASGHTPPIAPVPDVAAGGMTAEELVRTLGRPEVAPPPLPDAAGDEVRRTPIAAPAGGEAAEAPGAGYVRPRPGHAVAPPREAVPAGGAASGRSRTLMRRLKALHATGRFESDGYAAYRGSVEEASVTFLSPAEARREPASQASAATPTERPANRFLKALTGKD